MAFIKDDLRSYILWRSTESPRLLPETDLFSEAEIHLCAVDQTVETCGRRQLTWWTVADEYSRAWRILGDPGSGFPALNHGKWFLCNASRRRPPPRRRCKSASWSLQMILCGWHQTNQLWNATGPTRVFPPAPVTAIIYLSRRMVQSSPPRQASISM